jgi:heme/copper-type cytochrome/quinol oxidase subunit 1
MHLAFLHTRDFPFGVDLIIYFFFFFTNFVTSSLWNILCKTYAKYLTVEVGKQGPPLLCSALFWGFGHHI